LKSRWKKTFILPIIIMIIALPACLYIPESARSNFIISRQQPVIETNRNLIVNIKGIAFHDYNGNGTREYDEPVLPALDLEFFDKEVDQHSKIQTDNSGAYNISVPSSTYQLNVGRNIPGYNKQFFRYLYISQYEVRDTDRLISITVNKDVMYDLALMQGFLTLPFSIVMGPYINTVFFDVDKRENFLRDWKGTQETYDQHPGIDYRIPSGTPVLASAPGQVLSSKYDQQSGNVIAIVHGLIITQYGHLSERSVRAGDVVTRGQRIGLSGSTGEWAGKFPHLHIDLSETLLPRIDIYRDITNPESISYWTVDNKPQYP
jgi:murein DD-endopeptidase MepM/ murein hydrolase activator NlpD